MADYICIDGGTTNTRLRYVRDRQIIESITLKAGANACKNDPEAYKFCLKEALEQLFRCDPLGGEGVECILASGMITSDLGLCALPHGTIPAGISELHDGMKTVLFPEITSKPFVFIRGLKAAGATPEETDVMRGEETELAGIQELLGKAACTYILPGSHNKIIRTDKDGRIVEFFTTLTGEMIAALAENTILKNSVDLSQTATEERYLIDGYEYCKREGLNKALFKVRIADTVFGRQPAACYSFFLGAVLCDEIAAILKSTAGKIVLGGKKQLREAICTLLKHENVPEVTCLSQQQTDACVALGAVGIYEYGKQG